ncbi:orotidine-5'-phosphate decarboxylase [Candidatus Purcelliella pentastirinorum]|uniref:Orotidine 5'-phosphate decarboxylase n=1 Tax=Candidatus Purcelliella pentastirinorum TaxID=472834 RepID=A0AAX3N759_9ENTR|nr:orotidine-5'-phosphate decarboxylase [Candidatus Purcelliella pentastirinorum]WDI78341.1 orotidine-5'-phosphate decarboxylase [Candidatus Purcelliella pentastirinorum]WDR80631.1 orotidine-5'-phosphate decarboxylase [Candidatus Purcelliella pentastirinorum]
MFNFSYLPIVVALDFFNKKDILNFIDQINPTLCRVKIGINTFMLFGYRLIDLLHKRGFKIFLDLKFHDIPNTVLSSIEIAAKMGVWMVDIHAVSGKGVLLEARNVLDRFYGDVPLLISVTLLTSLNDHDLIDLGISFSTYNYTELLAKLSYDCGMDGVVCSGYEANNLKIKFGKNFKLIVPGIRCYNDNCNDQKRIINPIKAKKIGIDYIVIGRPIINSLNPLKKIKDILFSINS